MKIFCPKINDSDLYWRSNETQQQRLSRWCNMFGNFKISYSYRDKEGIDHFSKHYSILELMSSQKGIDFMSKANHRQILPVELVLDLDDNPTIEKLNKICQNLESLRCIYYAYKTGSKGYHIHVFDYGFVTERYKHEIKKSLIHYFNCDGLKFSEML